MKPFESSKGIVFRILKEVKLINLTHLKLIHLVRRIRGATFLSRLIILKRSRLINYALFFFSLNEARGVVIFLPKKPGLRVKIINNKPYLTFHTGRPEFRDLLLIQLLGNPGREKKENIFFESEKFTKCHFKGALFFSLRVDEPICWECFLENKQIYGNFFFAFRAIESEIFLDLWRISFT